MMKDASFTPFIRLGLTMAAILLTVGSPLRAEPAKSTTHYGSPASLGNGQIRTFVTVTTDHVPSSVGVEFDAALLDQLPTEASDGRWDIVDSAGNVVWHCCGHEVELSFAPAVAGLIPFRHFVMNWNPAGHFPPDIYDVPHFDLHFYTIDSATRQSILAPTAEMACGDPGFAPVTCEDLALLTQPLPADQQPPGYLSVDAVEPGMGNHLLDFSSGEWNGRPFTHTWIFGTMGGNLSFWEPMITRDYLGWVKDLSPSLKAVQDPNGGSIRTTGSGSSVTIPIRIPAAAPVAGYYPTHYQIQYRKPGRTFRVSLESLILLPASAGSE